MADAKKTYLNLLKEQISNALNGNTSAQPNSEPNQVERLNTVRHFNIPIPEEPPEGWVDIEDGMRKLEALLKPHEREREALLKPLAVEWIEAWLNLAEIASRFNEVFDTIEQANSPQNVVVKNTQRVRQGKMPSLTLFLLDRTIKFERKRSDTVRYQEDVLLKAWQLVEACVERRSAGGDDFIRQLAKTSFTKNAKGDYSRSGMVKLRKMVNDDPQWKQAMDLIDEAEIVDGVASYILVSIRDVDGKYHPLPLDISSIRPYRVVPAMVKP